MFEIHISKTYPTDSGDMVSTSRLSLTDLAGSERSSKVGTSGTSLQEGNNINKSLSTLGRCIAVLVDISQGKKGLAPFRDSVLTLYLRDALAGNVLTTMLANVSPVSSNMDETVSTLRFAASAKRIKTKVTKNEDLQQKRIRELTEELEAVKKEMAMHIRLAEGAKKLVLHLNGGEIPDAPLSDDEDEPAGAGKATIAILRSAIAERSYVLYNYLKNFLCIYSITGRRQSEPVVGWGITAELSPLPSSEHHKRSAGAQCTQRGTCHDAYGPRNAYLWRHQAPLAHPLVNLRCAEPVVGGGITAELSPLPSSEHHNFLYCLLLFKCLGVGFDVARRRYFYMRPLEYKESQYTLLLCK